MRIRPFYLDTSPAVKIGKGERSFHIFYMMLSGMPDELRDDLKLGPVTMFQTLSQSGCFLIPGRTDADNYAKFIEALNTFEINPTIQLQILKILAAILWLGNINFIMRGKGVQMGCSIVNDEDLSVAAELLSVETSDLRHALCYKVVGNTEVLMEAIEATMSKNLLVRVLYYRVFMFVVQSMNARIYRGSFGASLSVIHHPGFECLLEGNSLEQLHINYCDEKLRRLFTDHTFERELRIYETEGVYCGEIVIRDNFKSVKLADSKRSGIFMMMDREFSLGSVLKDDSLLSKMTTAYMHTNSTKNSHYNHVDTRTPLFTIRHYTGEVTYSVQGFMNKNFLDLSPNTINYLKKSQSPVLKNILALGNRKSSGAVIGQSTELSRRLEVTIANLQSSNCTFVHCIKGNNSLERDIFDSSSVLQQLKALEITAQVQIRKLGYMVHISHRSFLQRFSRCVDLLQMKKIPVVLSSSIGDAFECTSVLEYLSAKLGFQNIEGTTSNWLVGATSVLLKSESILETLNICRMNVCAHFVIKVQKVVRGYILRNIVMPKKHANRYDSKMRMKMEQKLMAREDILSKQYTVVMNQLAMLEETARQKLLAEKRAREKIEKDRLDFKLFRAAVTIQKRTRGILARRRVLIKRCVNTLTSAIALHDETKLQSALEYVEGLKLKSSQLTKLRNVAKSVLLAAHSDNYVSTQLSEAISSSSVTMLSDAIRLAENAKCTHIPEYSQASTALAEISTRRNLVLLLSSELERSKTVAELVSRADKIERLISRMVDTGLAAEAVVLEAHQRIQRIQNLLTIRNSIRAAVELCCVSDIDAAMSRRDDMIALYGESLFISEAAAVASMKRMLKLEACMYDGFEERDPTLPRLPKFIRNLLDTVRSPQTAAQADEARDRLLLLVPVQEDLQTYMRVFKWIIAICGWRYPREQGEPIGVLQLTTHPKSSAMALSTTDKNYAASEYTVRTKKTAATTTTQRSAILHNYKNN
jgi:myosin heavy subunit